MKFEAEGRELAKILRSQEQFIQTVKGQNNFWGKNTYSWRFLISNKLEQLEFKFPYSDCCLSSSSVTATFLKTRFIDET